MNIAVTGASGFVGQALVKALIREGYAVRALQNRGVVSKDRSVEIICGDLHDKAALDDLLQGCDVLIHCAALVAAKSKRDFDHVNVAGTQNLVDAAQAQGVGRMLLMSSLAAREKQLSAYAHSKFEAEQVVRGSSLDWDVFRPPAVYGPGDVQMLRVFKLLKFGVGLTPAGPGSYASVLYIDDLVSGVLAWIRAEQATKSIFEIASPAHEDESWGALLTTAAACLGGEIRFVTPPRFLLYLIAVCAEIGCVVRGRPVFMSRGKIAEICHGDWRCNPEPVRAALDWVPTVTFADGIANTLAWYKEHHHM